MCVSKVPKGKDILIKERIFLNSPKEMSSFSKDIFVLKSSKINTSIKYQFFTKIIGTHAFKNINVNNLF